VRASEGFRYKDSWAELQRRAMEQDVSWDKSAIEYDRLYKSIKGV
jgi:starch synthase